MDRVFLNLFPQDLITNLLEKVGCKGQLVGNDDNGGVINKLEVEKNFYQLITYILAQISSGNGIQELNKIINEVVQGNGEDGDKLLDVISLMSGNTENLLPYKAVFSVSEGRMEGKENISEWDKVLSSTNGGNTIESNECKVRLSGDEVRGVLVEQIESRGMGNVGNVGDGASEISEGFLMDILAGLDKDRQDVLSNCSLGAKVEGKGEVIKAGQNLSSVLMSNVGDDKPEGNIAEIFGSELVKGIAEQGSNIVEDRNYEEEFLIVVGKSNGERNAKEVVNGDNYVSSKETEKLLRDKINSYFLSSIDSKDVGDDKVNELLTEIVKSQTSGEKQIIGLLSEPKKERVGSNNSVGDPKSVQYMPEVKKVLELLGPKEAKVVEETLRFVGGTITKVGAGKDVINVFFDSVQLLKDGEIKSVLVRLKPEYLGELNVRVSYIQGEITIRLSASNQDVQKLLLGNVQQLKDFLKQDGIAVQEVQVVYSGGWSDIANLQSGMRFQSNDTNGYIYPDIVARSSSTSEKEVSQINLIRETYHNGNINLLA